MSIATAVQDLRGRIGKAYSALEAKGASMPAARTTANLPATIGSLPGGGHFVKLDTESGSSYNNSAFAVTYADGKQPTYLRTSDTSLYQIPAPGQAHAQQLLEFQWYLHGAATITATGGSGFRVGGQVFGLNQPYTFKGGETVSLMGYCQCLRWGTGIAMADGTVRNVEDLQVGDMVRCLNPETGALDGDEVTYADGAQEHSWCIWDEWRFSDGSVLNTVNRHRFYNV